MLTVLFQILVSVLLITGCVLALLAAVGLHRFPDLFCRMHAATKPATLGLVLIALAATATVITRGASIKLLLVIALQFLTAPVSAHMVGRAAYRSGIPMSDLTVIDELGRDEELRRRYGAV